MRVPAYGARSQAPRVPAFRRVLHGRVTLARPVTAGSLFMFAHGGASPRSRMTQATWSRRKDLPAAQPLFRSSWTPPAAEGGARTRSLRSGRDET